MLRHVHARADLTTILLLLSVAAVVTYSYATELHRSDLALRMTLHDQIIEGTAHSPYRYRVLVPFMGEALMRALVPVLSRDNAFRLAYAICDFTAVLMVLVSLFVWLREWFSAERSLIGVLFVAATMSIALQDHYFQPWSLPETALLVTALIVMRRGFRGALAGLVVVATLNRETAVLIPLAFLATSVAFRGLPSRQRSDLTPVLFAAGLFALWLAVFVGLRYFRGDTTPVVTVAGVLSLNLTPRNLAHAVLNGSLFLGAFWAFAVLGFRSAPPFVRRLALIVPPYVATIALWGVWYEVRLLMPLYAVLIPLGLSFMYPEHAEARMPFPEPEKSPR